MRDKTHPLKFYLATLKLYYEITAECAVQLNILNPGLRAFERFLHSESWQEEVLSEALKKGFEKAVQIDIDSLDALWSYSWDDFTKRSYLDLALRFNKTFREYIAVHDRPEYYYLIGQGLHKWSEQYYTRWKL